jgi:hypothetical protein
MGETGIPKKIELITRYDRSTRSTEEYRRSACEDVKCDWKSLCDVMVIDSWEVTSEDLLCDSKTLCVLLCGEIGSV